MCAPLVAALMALYTPAAQASPEGIQPVSLSTGSVNDAAPDATGGTQWGFLPKTLTVPDTASGTVTDVDVSLRITHPRAGDLFLRLSHAGRAIALTYQNGGEGDDFGSGNADCTGTQTVFDDSAATGIWEASATPPFAGPYRPYYPLGLFTGDRAEGPWQLDVIDTAAGNTGTLHCWSITVTVDTDTDDDGVLDATDNCDAVPNALQENNEGDTEGDACDSDDDNDAIEDSGDNCPTVSNEDQLDTDLDSIGDACDLGHQRSLTLVLRRHLRASGVLSVPDGFKPCKRVYVNIQRRRDGKWRTIAETSTSLEGTFSTTVPDRAGRYRVVAPPRHHITGGGMHLCERAVSPVGIHSH